MNKPISTNWSLSSDRTTTKLTTTTLKLSYWRRENIKFFSIPEENDKNTDQELDYHDMMLKFNRGSGLSGPRPMSARSPAAAREEEPALLLRGGTQIRYERAAEIEPKADLTIKMLRREGAPKEPAFKCSASYLIRQTSIHRAPSELRARFPKDE